MSVFQQRKREREEKVLKEQKRKREEMITVVSIVEELRRKPNWTEKVTNLELRKVYTDEAMAQGVPKTAIERALTILETLAQCFRPSISKSSQDMEGNEESVPLSILVGETVFDTSTDILTADNESMLSRKFGSLWFNPESASPQPVEISTATNSAKLFSVILSYLHALKNQNSNLCPNIDELSYEEIEFLQQDCDYLGLRRLSIAIGVNVFTKTATSIENQKKTAINLSSTQSTLTKLEAEKQAIEKRLAELPDLIVTAKTAYDKALSEREKAFSVRPCIVGDQIKYQATSLSAASGWSAGVVEESDGNLIVKRKYCKADPLPPPSQYFHSCYEINSKCDEILFADHFLPNLLSQSLEDQLDELLNTKSLDIHPGSNCQVIDLIHPSMYPYIKGVSQFLNEEEENTKLALTHFEKDNKSDYSWLPSEFVIDENKSVTIASYINNLNQDEQPRLYEDISSVFQSMLPMFEKVMEKGLASTKLQVIVKAAYYLIPPGESYSGSWHLEGMPHEHIVAAGIYYIAVSDNINSNTLAFRKELPEDYYYDDEDNGGYRAGEEVELIDDLGKLETSPKRALVWSNYLQHKVGSLRVNSQDKQSGIRKILCFFLVDPDVKVISTEMVAKQQDVIPLEAAFEHRQKLMNERKYHADKVTGMWEERTFTFCEH